tara:strand:- start:77 stop:1258 length:1182 start_codon:yes stop_codon:yes gene_type:complete
MIYFTLISLHETLDETHITLDLSEEEQQPTYNTQLFNYLSKTKKSIDLCIDQWDTHKKYTNSCEFIHTHIPGYKSCISKINPLSRAFFKMIEIANMFDLCKSPNIMNSFHLAEGPGGFIEAIVYLRNNNFDNYCGMTLINNDLNIPGWKKSQYFLDKYKDRVSIELGKDDTGDLYNPENFTHCFENYANSKDFISADGGFDFSLNFNKQENNALRLIYTEICYALVMQKRGGNFVLKMFDLFLKASVDIIYILSLAYEMVMIMKPSTSRSANSEKYIICKNFKLDNSSQIYEVFKTHLQTLYNTKKENINIKNLLKIPIQYNYLCDIKELNSILGQHQLETINSTLMLIEQPKKKEKLDNFIKQNMMYCVEWCEENNIPYHKNLNETNIFLHN